MEIPAVELALDEPSFGGLTFDEALVRWGRVCDKERLESVLFFSGPECFNDNEKLIEQFLSGNVDDVYLLEHLPDKPKRQILREGLLERWVDHEIIVSGFPLHSQGDRRVWISSALINELRYSLTNDPVSNHEARHGDYHARGARSYAQVRYYLASMVGTAAAGGERRRAIRQQVISDAEPAARGTKLPVGQAPPNFRGAKGTVWRAIEAHGYRPDFSARGARADFAKKIANETGVEFKTVESYINKRDELGFWIEQMQETPT